MEKGKNKKKTKTLQARLDGKEIEALERCKEYFGHKSDATFARFLIMRTADNIKNGKPLSIIPQM
jgi:hypothetical protein